MGKVVKKAATTMIDPLGIRNLFKTKKVDPIIASKEYFDVSKEVAPAQQQLGEALTRQQELVGVTTPAQRSVIEQMGKAAQGLGPSLAEVQMRSAQERNLAQQLAATQAGRGGSSALSQRTLMQNLGQANRELGQQAVAERLRERDAFLAQANLAGQQLRSDIGQKLNVDLMPKQTLQAWEQGRVGALSAAQQANADASNKMKGALLGGLADIGGTFVGKMPMGAPKAAADGGKITKDGAAKGYQQGGSVNKDDKKEPSFMDKLKGTFATTAAEETENKRRRELESIKEFRKKLKEDFEYQRMINQKDGGKISGPGTSTSDSIPAMLSDGEFVVKAKVVSNPVVEKFLHKLNSEKIKPSDIEAILSKRAKLKSSKK